MSDPKSLRDILSAPVKETEIGDVIHALSGNDELQTVVRRLAFQRDTKATGIYTVAHEAIDVAKVYAMAEDLSDKPSFTAIRRLIDCLRECAMEAEIGHEMSCFRVELLHRHGLTDSSDPAFGPIKYPDQGKPQGDPEPF